MTIMDPNGVTEGQDPQASPSLRPQPPGIPGPHWEAGPPPPFIDAERQEDNTGLLKVTWAKPLLEHRSPGFFCSGMKSQESSSISPRRKFWGLQFHLEIMTSHKKRKKREMKDPKMLGLREPQPSRPRLPKPDYPF